LVKAIPVWGTQATRTQATRTQATGTQATGTQATGTQATGTQATGTQATGTQATEITWYQWRNSRAYDLLWNVDSRPTEWIYAEDMTDQEKSDYPTYETTGGYLKERDISKAYQEWWGQLSDDQKQCIKEIPNFDAKKFQQITGINVEVA